MEKLANIIKTIITLGLEKFGIYYSKYRGIVTSIEDPDNLHRIQVQVPQIYGTSTLDYWVWPIGVYSGKDWGVQLLPRVGDMVWVEFEFGNPRRPLWSHGYRGKGDFIGPYFTNKEVIGIKTKAGHEIIIDDSNSLLRIVSAGGMVIDLSDVIHLGNADGEGHEPAVLGNTEQEKWEEIIDILMAAEINTQLGPQGFLPDTQLALEELKASIPNIKSQKITLL